MTTEALANAARKKHSRFLVKLGAHAIAVDKVRRHGTSTFGVIAFFERRPSQSVPSSLAVETGTKTVNVPLVVRISKKFTPDG